MVFHSFDRAATAVRTPDMDCNQRRRLVARRGVLSTARLPEPESEDFEVHPNSANSAPAAFLVMTAPVVFRASVAAEVAPWHPA